MMIFVKIISRFGYFACYVYEKHKSVHINLQILFYPLFLHKSQRQFWMLRGFKNLRNGNDEYFKAYICGKCIFIVSEK